MNNQDKDSIQECILSIFSNYNKLSGPDKTSIKRCNNLDELLDVSATYKALPQLNNAMLRILYICPFVSISTETEYTSLGKLLSKAGVSEARIKLELSNFNNIKRLLMLCNGRIETKITVDALLEVFFWKNDRDNKLQVSSKQKILRDFFIDKHMQSKQQEE